MRPTREKRPNPKFDPSGMDDSEPEAKRQDTRAEPARLVPAVAILGKPFEFFDCVKDDELLPSSRAYIEQRHVIVLAKSADSWLVDLYPGAKALLAFMRLDPSMTPEEAITAFNAQLTDGHKVIKWRFGLGGNQCLSSGVIFGAVNHDLGTPTADMLGQQRHSSVTGELRKYEVRELGHQGPSWCLAGTDTKVRALQKVRTARRQTALEALERFLPKEQHERLMAIEDGPQRFRELLKLNTHAIEDLDMPPNATKSQKESLVTVLFLLAQARDHAHSNTHDLQCTHAHVHHLSLRSRRPTRSFSRGALRWRRTTRCARSCARVP